MAAIHIVDEADTNKNGLYFTHTDYQGNLLALTSENTGNVVKRYAYDPWGNRRNPENWAEAANLDGKYPSLSVANKQCKSFGVTSCYVVFT